MPLISSNWPRFVQRTVRYLLGLLILAGLLLGIGMLPGKIEGVYDSGRIFQCGCGCTEFIRFENGQLFIHSSRHAPAQLFGRYETTKDGSVAIYMAPFRFDSPEKVSFTATPRLWFTHFHLDGAGTSSWHKKRPRIGRLRTLIEDQEISFTTLPNETTMVTTYYNSEMEEIRKESKAIKHGSKSPDTQ